MGHLRCPIMDAASFSREINDVGHEHEQSPKIRRSFLRAAKTSWTVKV